MINTLVTVGLAFSLIGFFAPVSKAADLPENMLIIGYDGEAWYPYRTDNHGDWIKIEGINDSAHLSLLPQGLVIKDDANSISLYSDSKGKKPYLSSEADGFTQVRGSDKNIAFVRLMAGKSRDTEIAVYDVEGNVIDTVNQSSAQFHPLVNGDKIYYAHVSCRADCEIIIQDVWVKTIGYHNARQLTKLNATTYLHSIDPSGAYGFISSNMSGYYHLGKLDLSSEEIIWITEGRVTDSYPSVSNDGDLFFIRRTARGSNLLVIRDVLTERSLLEQVHLPDGVTKLRYLEILN